MPVTFICPFCKKHYTAPDHLMGKVAACPGCGNEFQIPTQGARDLYEAAAFEMHQEAAAADFAPEPAATTTNTTAPGRCPACGQKVPNGSRICVACGQNIFEPVVHGGQVSHSGDGYSTGSARPGKALPLILALFSFLLIAVSTALYIKAAYDATLVLSTLTIPLAASAMAKFFRRHQSFAGIFTALLLIAGLILLVLSVVAKHASTAAEPLRQSPTSWHGGHDAPLHRPASTLC